MDAPTQRGDHGRQIGTLSRRSTVTKVDVYQKVADEIIASLEAGTVPWHQPWAVRGGQHRSVNGNRPYRGINPFLLEMTRQAEGYTSTYWLTYRQAEKLGGHVRKGERSQFVILWDFIPEKKGGKPVLTKAGKPKMIPVLRYFSVFNVEQTEGCTFPRFVTEVREAPTFEPIAEAQRIVDDMPNPPSIGYGGNEAFYAPAMDHVQLPLREQFESPEAFYAALFHELSHSTGHETRLNRRGPDEDRTFGSHDYGREELVAEMGSAFLQAHAGIETQRDQSAGYIANWLVAIKADPKAVVIAAGKAQKVADYILGTTVAAEETETEQQAVAA